MSDSDEGTEPVHSKDEGSVYDNDDDGSSDVDGSNVGTMEGKTWRDLKWIDDDPSKGLDRDKMDWVPRLKAGDKVALRVRSRDGETKEGEVPLPPDLAQHLLDLREVDMSEFKVEGDVDLSFVVFQGNVDLTGVRVRNGSWSFMFGANLENADLREANLEKAMLVGADLENANLEHANLENAILEYAKLEYAQLTGANLENARLIKANLENADLIQANLENACLIKANLENADLTHANLENANLEYAKLENAQLGANLKNAKMPEAKLENANLTHAILENADLRNAKLENAQLTGATLENAFMINAKLENANLSHAILENAELVEAKLENADLTEANLKNANLTYADFTGATFERTMLTGHENMTGATFGLASVPRNRCPPSIFSLDNTLRQLVYGMALEALGGSDDADVDLRDDVEETDDVKGDAHIIDIDITPMPINWSDLNRLADDKMMEHRDSIIDHIESAGKNIQDAFLNDVRTGVEDLKSVVRQRVEGAQKQQSNILVRRRWRYASVRAIVPSDVGTVANAKMKHVAMKKAEERAQLKAKALEEHKAIVAVRGAYDRARRKIDKIEDDAEKVADKVRLRGTFAQVKKALLMIHLKRDMGYELKAFERGLLNWYSNLKVAWANLMLVLGLPPQTLAKHLSELEFFLDSLAEVKQPIEVDSWQDSVTTTNMV